MAFGCNFQQIRHPYSSRHVHDNFLECDLLSSSSSLLASLPPSRASSFLFPPLASFRSAISSAPNTSLLQTRQLTPQCLTLELSVYKWKGYSVLKLILLIKCLFLRYPDELTSLESPLGPSYLPLFRSSVRSILSPPLIAHS